MRIAVDGVDASVATDNLGQGHADVTSAGADVDTAPAFPQAEPVERGGKGPAVDVVAQAELHRPDCLPERHPLQRAVCPDSYRHGTAQEGAEHQRGGDREADPPQHDYQNGRHVTHGVPGTCGDPCPEWAKSGHEMD